MLKKYRIINFILEKINNILYIVNKVIGSTYRFIKKKEIQIFRGK